MTTEDDTDRQLTSEPGEWLSILDAAQRLKIRDRSVRRMAAEGRLLRRLRQGKAEVWVPESLSTVDPSESTPVTSSDVTLTASDDSDRALAIIGQQQAMIAWLNQQAMEQQAPLRAMIDERDETIRRQAEEIGRLKAELDAEMERQLPSVDVPDTRPWWRRWLP